VRKALHIRVARYGILFFEREKIRMVGDLLAAL
jgi:hypothetical protein